MNKFFLLLLLLHGFVSSIEAQIVTIPDANFKNYLVNVLCVDTDGDGIPDDDVDTNNDGEVQVSEAEVVTFLKTSSGNISNLEGIQYFVNLQEFHCTFNHITNMDVTYSLDLRKLVCYRNELTAIHPGNYPNLEYLSVGENFLTSIDISDNSNLYYLAFPHNSISSINLLNNAPLEVLVGSYNN